MRTTLSALLVAATTLTTGAVATAPATAGPQASVLYLTFDDGPHSSYTPQVLNLLKQHQAKATFFVIGANVGARTALLKRAVAEGHRIGNHTFQHENLTKLSASAVNSTIDRTQAAIAKAGTTSTCLRPPFGATNSTVKSLVAKKKLAHLLWSVDTEDWRRPGASVIANRILKGAKPGAVILMHDGGGDRSQTVAALKTVLPQLVKRGYTMATLPACR